MCWQAAGTYAVTSTLIVERSVVLTADVEGSSVVLDGGHTGGYSGTRVMRINSGIVELIGLTITRGGGMSEGVYVSGGTVTFDACIISGNSVSACLLNMISSLN